MEVVAAGDGNLGMTEVEAVGQSGSRRTLETTRRRYGSLEIRDLAGPRRQNAQDVYRNHNGGRASPTRSAIEENHSSPAHYAAEQLEHS